MPQRASDDASAQHLFDRKVPLTWVMSALAIVAGQAITMWANQREIAKDVANVNEAQKLIAADVKQIKQDVQVISIESVKTSIKLDELQRRVTALEQAQVGAKK